MKNLSIIIPSYNEKLIDLVVFECRLLFPQAQIIVGKDVLGNGKGWANKKSIFFSLGGVIALIDGDMDIHPKMIKRLLPYLDDYDIVVGTKGIKNIPLKRKVITILSRIYIRLLFGLKVDTQTGIKVFKRYKIPEWFTSGFSFDMELLAKAQRRGIRIVEVPIEAKVSKSKSIKVLFKTLLESLKIWYRLSFRDTGKI